MYEITTDWANATGTPKTSTIIHKNYPTERYLEVEGLLYPARYSVVIRATTKSGLGAGSKEIFRFTKYLAPDERTPRNVSHRYLTSTSVTLNWKRPLYRQSLLNYTLSVHKVDGYILMSTRVVKANETSASLGELTPNMLFSATLVAGYKDGSFGDDSDHHLFQTPPSGKVHR